MTLRVPPDLPGYAESDPYRPTPQPHGVLDWLALIRRIWRAWQHQRQIERRRRESGRIL